MANRRLGVMGLKIHRPGQTLSPFYSDNGLRWLFDPRNSVGIPRYIRDCTAGEIDIDTQIFDTITLENKALSDVLDGIAPFLIPDSLVQQRSFICAALWDAVDPVGLGLSTFDGVVFMVLGRRVGAGATSVDKLGARHPVALLDDFGEHTFIAHEIGHVLGMEHSHRPELAVAGQLYGEYGDPVDIMSAQTFGGHLREVTFALGHVTDSGIDAACPMWTRAGPGLSPATLWRYQPGFPTLPSWAAALPGPGKQMFLMAAHRAQRRLLVWRTGSGNDCYTVEFRPSTRWDRALTAAPGRADNAAASGVVIHQIKTLGTTGDGDGWPKQDRVCYLATIPVPSTGNDDWSDGTFSVRVTSEPDSDGIWVIAGTSLPPGQTVTLACVATPGNPNVTAGPPTQILMAGPSCGKETFTTERISTPVTLTVTASATGYTRPQFQFQLNGTSLGMWSGPGSPKQNSVASINTDVAVPTGFQASTQTPTTIYISWEITGNRLTLDLPSGDGSYTLSLNVIAAHVNSGLPSEQTSAEQEQTVTTLAIELPQAALEAQDACEATLAGYQPIPPDLPGNPFDPIVFPDDWSVLPPEELATALSKLDAVKDANPEAVQLVTEHAARQLQVRPEALRQAGAKLNRRG